MYYSTLFALGIGIELIAHLTNRYLAPYWGQSKPPRGSLYEACASIYFIVFSKIRRRARARGSFDKGGAIKEADTLKRIRALN